MVRVISECLAHQSLTAVRRGGAVRRLEVSAVDHGTRRLGRDDHRRHRPTGPTPRMGNPTEIDGEPKRTREGLAEGLVQCRDVRIGSVITSDGANGGPPTAGVPSHGLP